VPKKPKNLKDLPYVSATVLLGICPKEYKSIHKKDTCTPMFIMALFCNSQLWNQPRCPTMDKWIKTLWYIYTMEYYSAIKKNKIMSLVGKWMELEITMLSTRN
jgi:hypothetical protein